MAIFNSYVSHYQRVTSRLTQHLNSRISAGAFALRVATFLESFSCARESTVVKTGGIHVG